jgi:hypothetical protein
VCFQKKEAIGVVTIEKKKGGGWQWKEPNSIVIAILCWS